MKAITKLKATALLTVMASASAFAQADPHAGHGAGHEAHQGHASPAGRLVDGEVKKVDKDAGKLTIRHGELKQYNMPAMTMVFRVKDPAMLNQVQAGDKVKFVVEKVNGALTVVQLQK